MMKIDLGSLLCYRLFKIVKLNEQLIDKNMGQFQLTRTQWKIIARFNFLPTPCTQQDMLTSMGIDRAHLTRALEQLETRGLLTRKRIAHDKRAYNILPTKVGLSLLNKIEDILNEESCLMSAGISKIEKNYLDQSLEKIELNVAKALRDCNKKTEEDKL